MRLSDKTISTRQQTSANGLAADFNEQDAYAQLKTKGLDVIHEKAYLCPCKSKESAHRNTCKNCAGTGWIFANPTRTRMVIIGIMADNKLKEGALRDWGMLDTGGVKITALPDDKLSYMDRITIIDGTAEHQQILYPNFTDDVSALFAYTKYNIESIDFIGIFQSETQKLKKLEETTDYNFNNNIITFDAAYHSIIKPAVTVRYVHRPCYHVVDILRESMVSPAVQGTQKLVLPVHAVGRRAHLIADAENFNGDRLLDNSWLPNSCEADALTKFERQLKYTSAQDIYDALTEAQRADLLTLLS